MSATTTVTAVGSALGDVLGTMEMKTTGSAFAGATVYLYVVNEISSHGLFESLELTPQRGYGFYL